ncbi:MAG: hypothetical protein AB8B61_04040 [Cyclobacteriaceae bacterium]
MTLLSLLFSCQKEEDTLTTSDVNALVNDLLNEGTVSGTIIGETDTNSVPIYYDFKNDNKITLSNYRLQSLNSSSDTVISFKVISKFEDIHDKESLMDVTGVYNINADTLVYGFYSSTYSFGHNGKKYSFISSRNSTTVGLASMSDMMDVTIDRESNKFTVVINDVQTFAADNIVNRSTKEASIHFTYSYVIPPLRGGIIPVILE